MDLKRDIYESLLRWKKEDSGKVLELNGARQVGKTYILDKFARENYKNYFYINMMQTSGQEYLMCLKKATEWEPGQERIERPLHKTFELFDKAFTDEKDTIVVIDEIQESAEVFSQIRQFARDFECHFIVTGSYLGKTLNKEYFLPAGDIDTLTMDTLSFQEFLDSVGSREMYESVGMYGEENHSIYDELKKWYDIYCQIGGYPASIKSYLETNDVEASRREIARIIQIFIEESERYFENILDVQLFEQIFPAIAQTMIKEKKGSGDLITELSGIIFKAESSRITKKSINQAIAWLYRSNIIGYCGKVNHGIATDVTPNCRFYFRDLGIACHYLNMAGADRGTIRGIISENFVYYYLRKKNESFEIAGAAPMFGEYKGGEIDFFVNSRIDYCNYAVEVKAGNNVGTTANLLLKDKKVDYVYLLKGDSYGGISEGGKYTIPIYLMGRVEFNKGI